VLSGRYASFGLYDEVTDNDRRRARELLAFFNCEDLAERRYGVMSQGEKQRVLVARALMADAEILILDEPAAGLDIPAREALLSSVERLAQNGEVATITFVTHHVEEIVPAFTHVVVLKEGRIVAAGPKREMLTGNVLTRTFGVPLVVEKAAGRFWPRIADNGVHCNSEQEE
jgi:iron complex transport system ATP-binding protein